MWDACLYQEPLSYLEAHYVHKEDKNDADVVAVLLDERYTKLLVDRSELWLQSFTLFSKTIYNLC